MRMLLGLLALLSSLDAQEYRANLLGIVTDSSGAAIPEAAVKVTNMDTGVSSPAVTNNDGSYLVAFLNPGRYSISVERAGFKAFERSPNIRRHTAPNVDFALNRNFQIREGPVVPLKVSAFNATNTPVFNFPATDPASPQLSPRGVEMGFLYAF